jgi:hypothetical protein
MPLHKNDLASYVAKGQKECIPCSLISGSGGKNLGPGNLSNPIMTEQLPVLSLEKMSQKKLTTFFPPK